jgi:hypothetical protein
VQRGQLSNLFDAGDYLVLNNGRRTEAVTAVDHSMSNAANAGRPDQASRVQPVQNPSRRLIVAGQVCRFPTVLTIGGGKIHQAFLTDAVGQATGQPGYLFGVTVRRIEEFEL